MKHYLDVDSLDVSSQSRSISSQKSELFEDRHDVIISMLQHTAPCGDPVLFGIRDMYQLSLFCLKRCLRLAHRHANQEGFGGDVNSCFHGFMMGNCSQREDEQGFVIFVDRFDPGTIRNDGGKTPSTPLPGDIIIPFVLENQSSHLDYANTLKSEEYENSLKLLHHQVACRLPSENICPFPLRLLALIKKDEPHSNEVHMELHWAAPCISNSIRAVPIYEIPITPNGLAKNLMDGSMLQNCSQTGFAAVDESTGLILLPGSNPQSLSMPFVGIWVSGVLSVHSPLVWLACMSYLHSTHVHDRLMVSGQFIVILFSRMSQGPLFFQVQSNDNDGLNFDLIYSEELVCIPKDFSAETESPFEFQFVLTSVPGPVSALKEREIFEEALKHIPTFITPKPKCKNTDNGICEEGTEASADSNLKKSLVPQSISRKNPLVRPSANENLSTVVSSCSYAIENDIYSNSNPMPLPSPHAASESESALRPSVPELSIIFDGDFPVHSEKQSCESNTKIANDESEITCCTTKSFRETASANKFTPSEQFDLRLKCTSNNPLETSKMLLNQKFGPCYSSAALSGQQYHMALGKTNAAEEPVPILPHPNQATSCPRMYLSNYQRLSDPRFNMPGSVSQPARHIQHSIPTFPSAAPLHFHQYANSHFMIPFPVVKKPVVASCEKAQMNLEVIAPLKQSSHQSAEMPPSLRSPHYVFPQIDKAVQPCSVIPRPNSLAPTLYWMKDLPPQAYQLLIDQDIQLRQLQDKVKKLLKLLEGNSNRSDVKISTADASTVTEPVLRDCLKVSRGTSMGTSIEQSCNEDVAELCHTIVDHETSVSTNPVSQHTFVEDANKISNIVAPLEDIQTRCNSGQSTDQYAVSEFASIHLDETNLREIASANNKDVDSESLASVMKVDLPVLDTSTEQSILGTPGQKRTRSELWDIHSSPVLGESASMCVAPSIHIENPLQEAENNDIIESEIFVDDKEGQFMKNILNRVCGMLQKTVDAHDSKAGNVEASDPERVKTKVATSSALQESMLPHLTDISLLVQNYSSDYACPTLSATELSMHANAIALKYLSNNQLEAIASLSRQRKRVLAAHPTVTTENGRSCSNQDPSVVDQRHSNSVADTGDNLHGLSLLSPCNMSLATRRYMEKYGLIESADSMNAEEPSDEFNEGCQTSRKGQQQKKSVVNLNDDCSQHGNMQSADKEGEGFHNQEESIEHGRKTEFEHGFSQLKVHLGDTLDMILPFLDDLDTHIQQAPSSDSKRDCKGEATGNNDTGNNVVSEPLNGKESFFKNLTEVGRSSKANEMQNIGDHETSQVLSPEILQAVASNKRGVNNHALNATYKTSERSQGYSVPAIKNDKSNLLMESRSRKHRRGNRELKFQLQNSIPRRNQAQKQSPCRKLDCQQYKFIGPTEEPVLTARVAQAFREKEQLN